MDLLQYNPELQNAATGEPSTGGYQPDRDSIDMYMLRLLCGDEEFNGKM